MNRHKPESKPEPLLLKHFKVILDELGISYLSGQGLNNRMPEGPSPSFQFGDLRIELPEYTIVVEVESSGGVTNLAKYWESIELCRVNKSIKLIHVFLQKSKNDYESHLALWSFLNAKMQKELGQKWAGYCFRTTGPSPGALEPALTQFRRILTENRTKG